MKTRLLGGTGVAVSEIGFGCWAIGGYMWGGSRDQDAQAALNRALDLRVNFFDTALVYGDGHSERLVGRVLRERGASDVLVATKIPPKNSRWTGNIGTPVREVFPGEWVRECAEKSLRNLGRERIDLLQLHLWEENWLKEQEWLEEMARLRAEGKIRLIGVSTNDHRPNEAVALAEAGVVNALQVTYNIFDQSAADELFQAAARNGVGIIVRIPLDEGSLTGKFTARTVFPDGDWRRGYFTGARLTETVERVERVRPILERNGESLTVGALRFCLSHPAVSTVIPGMRSPAQVDSNCGAADAGPLPRETLASLAEHCWVRGGEMEGVLRYARSQGVEARRTIGENVWTVRGVELRLDLRPDVFHPTSTSTIMGGVLPVRSGDIVIDLGCGSGFLSILAARLGAGRVYAVDILPQAVELTRVNAEKHGLGSRITALTGSLFDPISSVLADIIVCDVSGVAERIARISPWYPPGIPFGGSDGAGPTVAALEGAAAHLKATGQMIFPVLSLANEDRILDAARRAFPSLNLLSDRWFPFPKTMTDDPDRLRTIIEHDHLRAQQRGSRLCWQLRIYRGAREYGMGS